MNNIKGYINKKEEGNSLYEALRLEAIEISQKLSSGVWTDYNEHDPGVTLIENIVYAITELAHKTLYPIQDILIRSKGSALHSGDNGFFIASDILTTGPITFTDYRKLWIDQIVNVKNVWIYPVDNYQRYVDNTKGLLHVFVEKYEYKTNPLEESKDNEEIMHELRAIYNANRNLCEDIYDIEIYKSLRLTMSLNISLSSQVNGEDILASIFYKVNNYLAPDIKYYSLWELQQDHAPINKIFNGPNLEKGFILDEDLKDPLEEIIISDILKIITQIQGITSVNDFFLQYEMPETGEVVQIHDRFRIPKNTTVIALFPESPTDIIFKTSDTFFQPDLNETKHQLSFIRALNYGGYKEASNALNKIPIPKGSYLDITSYFPVRKQLPELYGIGDRGIGSEATELRKAQVKQLQAYLMPFDQLMVNFLAQLSNLYALYDVNHDSHASYFTKELPDIGELYELVKPKGKKFDISKWKQVLNEINDSFDTDALKRHNDIANHLLSRFDETFQTYALRKINSRSYGDILINDTFEKKLLMSKRKLLREYGSISYDRAKSFNYHQTADPQSQLIPGILRKLAILMDINNFSIKSLVKGLEDSEIKIHPLTLEIEVVIKTINMTQEHYEVIEIDDVIIDEEIQDDLYHVMHYVGDKETILKDTLKNGVIAKNYEIKKSLKEALYYVFYKNTNQESNIAHLARSRETAIMAVKSAVDYLVMVNQRSEGFFMIEHLLLLPPYQGDYYGFHMDFSLLHSPGLNVKFTHKELSSCQKRDETLALFISQWFLGKLEFLIIHEYDRYKVEISSYRDDGKVKEILMVSENKYYSKEDLKKELDILKSLNTKLDKKQLESIIKCHVNYGYDKKPIDEHFFSFQATFILPSWPVRFQSENFKQIFENAVYEQLPIHIKYGIHWLDYEELKIFEVFYFEWLKQLPIPSMVESRMDLAYELVILLQDLMGQQHEV